MKDFLLDESFDMIIKDGDFAIGESDKQQQTCLLMAEKGSYKQYPTVGVGAVTFLKDENPDELLREIRIQFSADGMKIQRLGFDGSKLKVVAEYGN